MDMEIKASHWKVKIDLEAHGFNNQPCLGQSEDYIPLYDEGQWRQDEAKHLI